MKVVPCWQRFIHNSDYTCRRHVIRWQI